MKAPKIGNKTRNGSKIAVILITSFISINAMGIGLYSNTESNDLKIEPADQSIEVLESGLANMLLEENAAIIVEEEIETEKWMMDINDDSWAQDTEEEMSLEDWMSDINAEVWNTTDTEEDMIIEDWMMNPSDWLN